MKFFSALRNTAMVAAIALGAAACAPQPNSAVYSTNRTMQASQVQFGTIFDARTVETRHVQSGDQTAGVLIGGALGALAGDQFGKGNGNVLMTGAGAIAGAAVGANVAKSANRSVSTEWFVHLDNGGKISVVQNDPSLFVGASVKVINDGRTTRLVR